MTKVPTAVTVSVLPEMEPAPVLLPSIVKTTGLPDAPPVATSEMVSPAEYVCGVVGCVKLMACAPGALETTVRCTCGAAE